MKPTMGGEKRRLPGDKVSKAHTGKLKDTSSPCGGPHESCGRYGCTAILSEGEQQERTRLNVTEMSGANETFSSLHCTSAGAW